MSIVVFLSLPEFLVVLNHLELFGCTTCLVLFQDLSKEAFSFNTLAFIVGSYEVDEILELVPSF